MLKLVYSPYVALPDGSLRLFTCFYNNCLDLGDPRSNCHLVRSHVCGFADRVEAFAFLPRVGANGLALIEAEHWRYWCSYALCRCQSKEYPLPDSFVVIEYGKIVDIFS